MAEYYFILQGMSSRDLFFSTHDDLLWGPFAEPSGGLTELHAASILKDMESNEPTEESATKFLNNSASVPLFKKLGNNVYVFGVPEDVKDRWIGEDRWDVITRKLLDGSYRCVQAMELQRKEHKHYLVLRELVKKLQGPESEAIGGYYNEYFMEDLLSWDKEYYKSVLDVWFRRHPTKRRKIESQPKSTWWCNKKTVAMACIPLIVTFAISWW